MLQTSNALPAKKRGWTNKLIVGFAALAATAVIGSTGLAFAEHADKPTKAECAAAGFKNYGQCVKEWAHTHHPGGGYGGGYGGNNHHNPNVNVDLHINNSNHNIITVIINFFS